MGSRGACDSMDNMNNPHVSTSRTIATSSSSHRSLAKLGSATNSITQSITDNQSTYDPERSTEVALYDPKEVPVELNVGGKIFRTQLSTLLGFPKTKLGMLASTAAQEGQMSVHAFYDRSPKLMNSVLDFYRMGELHLPTNTCWSVLERELKFWGIPLDMVHECCWHVVRQHQKNARTMEKIDAFLADPRQREHETAHLTLPRKLWLILEHTRYSQIGQVWSFVYFSVVVLAIVFYSLETSSSFRVDRPIASNYPNRTLAMERLFLTAPVPWLQYTIMGLLIFFSVDIILRCIVCPDKSMFFAEFKNWLDLLLTLKALISLLLDTYYQPSLDDRNMLMVAFIFHRLDLLRAVRIFYVARSFDTMKVLMLSTRATMREMALLSVCVTCFITMFGGLIYTMEFMSYDGSDESNDNFQDVYTGMWFSIVTMTTVGYGDVYPKSTQGRLVAAVCALAGVLVLALPVAVISGSFEHYAATLVSRKQQLARIKYLMDHPGIRLVKRRRGFPKQPRSTRVNFNGPFSIADTMQAEQAASTAKRPSMEVSDILDIPVGVKESSLGKPASLKDTRSVQSIVRPNEDHNGLHKISVETKQEQRPSLDLRWLQRPSLDIRWLQRPSLDLGERQAAADRRTSDGALSTQDVTVCEKRSFSENEAQDEADEDKQNENASNVYGLRTQNENMSSVYGLSTENKNTPNMYGAGVFTVPQTHQQNGADAHARAQDGAGAHTCGRDEAGGHTCGRNGAGGHKCGGEGAGGHKCGQDNVEQGKRSVNRPGLAESDRGWACPSLTDGNWWDSGAEGECWVSEADGECSLSEVEGDCLETGAESDCWSSGAESDCWSSGAEGDCLETGAEEEGERTRRGAKPLNQKLESMFTT